jgi:hypothetical protein
LNEASGDLPFLRAEFIAAALTAFGDGKELLCTLFEDGECVAMIVVHRSGRGFWTTFQPAQLPLGAAIVRRGCEFPDLLSHLVAKLPGFALTIALSQQDPIYHARPADSPKLATLDYIETPRIVVEGSFDDYWAARGKNLRTNAKKQRAKLKSDGIVARLDVLARPESVSEAIAEYSRMESSGWKGDGGTAVREDNAQGKFYREVFEVLCSAGIGRIYRYTFDGKAVAMDLCLLGSRALVVLKTTFDQTYRAVSPATLLREEYFRLLFDEAQCPAIEFYGRAMEWHSRWTVDVRKLYHVNYYRWSWLRRMHGSLRRRRWESLSE